MDEMIGYCGYKCHLCAARSDDPEIRQKLVDGWRKIFGHEMYTAGNVRCDGCKSDGHLADSQCRARPCAIGRKLESCAQCDDFGCDKVRNLMGSRDAMMTKGHRKLSDLTREEYDLCMRQFDSIPNLVKLLVKAKKLPGWVLEED